MTATAPIFKQGIRFLLLSILTLLSAVGYSQLKNVGAVVSYQKVDGGITGKTATHYFDIRAYSNEVVRVRISQKNDFSSFSYLLDKDCVPNYTPQISTQDNIVYLKTSAIHVEIELKPALRITFKDSTGTIINEDEKGEGFGTTFAGGKVTSYKHLQAGERFVGMGEALGNLDRSGTVVNLHNRDNFHYGDPRLSMYSSIPFFIGLHHHSMYGILYHNTYDASFNFGAGNARFTSITHEGGDVDYFYIFDQSIPQIISHYTWITGRSPLPPIWSLGYHQSRCSYYPQNKALWIAKTFRDKHIPLDCIVLDADYLYKYEPFRLNHQRFPNMKGLADEMKAMGIELTASVNPGICTDSSYLPMHDAMSKKVLLNYADGTPYMAPIPPNMNYYIDYTLPAGRQWWKDQMKMLEDNGIKGYWNDMNEPAVTESAMPDNVVFNFDGHPTSSMEARNLFGMQMARSSYEAGLQNGHGIRPFVMTRSSFAGIQRYAAVWTGDNTADDEHLLSGVLLNNSMGLSGVPFVGPDLGGFIGDGSNDLFKRWVEVGMFSAFVRNHRNYFDRANEPWAYGEEAEGIAKAYIQFRYRLLPYVYDQFYEATQNGLPLSRSLCISNPYDAAVYSKDFQYQFQFGNALMIVPLTSKESYKKIYFPAGKWYDLYTDEERNGKQAKILEFPIFKLPIYVKEGSILPLQSQVETTKQLPSDTLYVHVYESDSVVNNYVHYEDDGSTFQYQQKKYSKRTFTYNGKNQTLTFGKQEGNFVSHFKYIAVVLHGFKNFTSSLQAQQVQQLLFDPLADLSDYYDADYMKQARTQITPALQQMIVITNSTHEVQTLNLE